MSLDGIDAGNSDALWLQTTDPNTVAYSLGVLPDASTINLNAPATVAGRTNNDYLPYSAGNYIDYDFSNGISSGIDGNFGYDTSFTPGSAIVPGFSTDANFASSPVGNAGINPLTGLLYSLNAVAGAPKPVPIYSPGQKGIVVPPNGKTFFNSPVIGNVSGGQLALGIVVAMLLVSVAKA